MQEVDSFMKRTRNIVNEIIKSLNDNTLSYTIQIAIDSAKPDKVYYSCQISPPAENLQPITWVFEDAQTLERVLYEAVDNLNALEVEKAYHEAEILRSKTLQSYHESKIKEIEKSQKSTKKATRKGKK